MALPRPLSAARPALWRTGRSRWGIPLIAVLLAILGGAVTNALVRRSDSSRRAQLALAAVQTQLVGVQGMPYQSGQDVTAAGARASISRVEAMIALQVAALERSAPDGELGPGLALVRANFSVLERQLALVDRGQPQVAYRLDPITGRLLGAATARLARAGDDYRAAAAGGLRGATIGSAAVIALLLVAFMFFYARASAARELNAELLARTRREALTDALTGLGNRRALFAEFDTRRAPGGAGGPLAVILLDLDGFKPYNDTFGHPAGDALLARLGALLADAVAPVGRAFRMGGDEFCVLAKVGADFSDEWGRRSAAAMSADGDGFRIECSAGVAMVAPGSTETEAALGLADRRLYADKQQRAGSAARLRQPAHTS